MIDIIVTVTKVIYMTDGNIVIIAVYNIVVTDSIVSSIAVYYTYTV